MTKELHRHLLATAEEAKRFTLGGSAILTLVSQRTGVRFTFKVTKMDRGEGYFVGLLAGPDNNSDYTYMGMIREGRFQSTNKSRINPTAPSYVAFNFFWFNVGVHGRMPTQLEVWHEGRCGRCNRRLTVPESIRNGIGPECATKGDRSNVVPFRCEAA